MIIRNKVVGAAPNILNNYNTAFNFNAIMERLDFTNADKRPIYILEQELNHFATEQNVAWWVFR